MNNYRNDSTQSKRVFTMTSLVLLITVVLIMKINAFVPKGARLSRLTASKGRVLSMAKTKDVDTSKYWQGDWVCADCGYVYDIDYDGGGMYFEQQRKGFICPQCSAPRRRYAKAVGDEWGVTNDGGDFPIYFLTFLGLAATTWFALVYVPTL